MRILCIRIGNISFTLYIQYAYELFGSKSINNTIQYISKKCVFVFSQCHIYFFTSHLRIVHIYGDVITAGEGLQNLGLCSAFRTYEQGGIFIVPHLLLHGTLVSPVSSEGPLHLVASYDTPVDAEDLF
jgi:hypothetical protein